MIRSRSTWVKLLGVTLILAIMASAAVSCGGTGGGDDDDQAAAPADARYSSSGTAAGGAQPTAASGTSGEAPAGSGSSSPDLAAQQDWNRMVMRTAQIDLQVGDVGAAISFVRGLAGAKGGYVASSSTYQQGDDQYAQITLEVPSEQFDAAMTELRSSSLVSKVLREEASSQDVTEEFVDNESRLRALEETQSRFLDLLSEANSVDDIIRLEYELNNVRGQIETLKGRQKFLEQRTSFSTIAVSIAPTGAASRSTNTASEGFSLVSVVERAWEHSRGAIDATLVALLTVGIFGAVFLPIALIVWFAYRLVRGRLQRSTATG